VSCAWLPQWIALQMHTADMIASPCQTIAAVLSRSDLLAHMLCILLLLLPPPLLLLLCRWIGVSRYTDHRHNIDDILGGFVAALLWMTPVSLIAIGQLTFYHQKMQQEEDEAAAAADADVDGELQGAIQMSSSAQQQQQQQHGDVESQMMPVDASASANGGYDSSRDAAATAAAAPADAAAVSHAGAASKPTLDNLKSLKQ
jgi:hypothetical protein